MREKNQASLPDLLAAIHSCENARMTQAEPLRSFACRNCQQPVGEHNDRVFVMPTVTTDKPFKFRCRKCGHWQKWFPSEMVKKGLTRADESI